MAPASLLRTGAAMATLLFLGCHLALSGAFVLPSAPSSAAAARVVGSPLGRAETPLAGRGEDGKAAAAAAAAAAGARARVRSQGAVRPLQGLFGLGAPEIAVIVVVAAFILGPDKLASLAKDAGKVAGELKEVPKEFQAGVSEGEMAALEQKKKITSMDDAAAVAQDSESSS